MSNKITEELELLREENQWLKDSPLNKVDILDSITKQLKAESTIDFFQYIHNPLLILREKDLLANLLLDVLVMKFEDALVHHDRDDELVALGDRQPMTDENEKRIKALEARVKKDNPDSTALSIGDWLT